MKNKEILIQALKQAKINGYSFYNYEAIDKYNYFDGDDWYLDSVYEDDGYTCIRDIIFSHDFAKAFWGENSTECLRCDGDGLEMCRVDGCDYDPNKKCKKCFGIGHHSCAWKYHLQEIILEEEPLKYLEQFLKTSNV